MIQKYMDIQLIKIQSEDGFQFTIEKDHEIFKRGVFRLIQHDDKIPISSVDLYFILYGKIEKISAGDLLLHIRRILMLSCEWHELLCVRSLIKQLIEQGQSYDCHHCENRVRELIIQLPDILNGEDMFHCLKDQFRSDFKIQSLYIQNRLEFIRFQPNITEDNQFDFLLNYINFDSTLFIGWNTKLLERFVKDERIVKYVFDHFLYLDFEEPNVKNILHVICESSSEYMIRILCEKLENVELEFENGDKLIHIASKRSLISVFQYLIDRGADLEVSNKVGWRPIHFICRHSNAELLDIILTHNINLEAETIQKSRPIHLLCRNPNIYMISKLIEKGVDIECKNDRGWSLIHIICKYGNTEMIRYAINLKVNLESETIEKWKPIHFACRYSNSDIIRYLVSKGVNLESETIDGFRPIHFICKYSDPDTILWFIGLNIELECKSGNHPFFTNDNNQTPHDLIKKYSDYWVLKHLEERIKSKRYIQQ